MLKIIKPLCKVVIAVLLLLSFCTTAFAVDKDYMAEHGEEGQKLWEEFIKYVDMYPEVFDEEPLESEYYKYNKYTYRDGHELDNVSGKEVFLWTYTVLTFYNTKISDSNGWYFSSHSGSEYIKRTFKIKYKELNEDDAQAVCDAYMALTEWEWEYYNSTGRLYNFMENKDSLDYINEHYEMESNAESETVSESDSIETVSENEVLETSETASLTSIVSSNNESYVNHVSSVSSENKGPWSHVFGNLKNSMFTIIVTVILVIALVVITYRKRKYNMGNDND